MQRFLWVCLCSGVLAAAAGEVPVDRLVGYSHPKLGLRVLQGELSLPRGPWRAVPGPADAPLRQVFVTPAPGQPTLSGSRDAKAERQRHVEQDGYPLHGLAFALGEYARTHEGKGPASIEEVTQPKNKDYHPWWGGAQKYFLIPNVAVPERNPGGGQAAPPAQLWAFELNPFVDDGKHYVLSSDRRVQRVPVDPELLARYGQKLVPQQPAELPPPPDPTAAIGYRLLALVEPAAQGQAQVQLKRADTGATVTVRLELGAVAPGDAAVGQAWASARAGALSLQSAIEPTLVLSTWQQLHVSLYGASPAAGAEPNRDSSRRLNMFSVLGGRAAVEETLQLQDLRVAGQPGPEAAPPEVQVATIKGVEVKAHPYEQMLGGQPGGRLPLADLAPVDHGFAYFAQPAALMGCLERGERFAFLAGTLATGNSLQYRLNDRYFASLGLDEQWVRQLLQANVVKELAVVVPDLYFIDGTDVTVLMTVPRLALVQPLLSLAGVGSLSPDGIFEKKLASGRSAWWAARGDRLLVSSNRAELAAVLALHANGGQGSLGQSAEFRYMLTKLPVQANTRIYAYLSDPFLRRLTGPAAKIGQYRRLQVRGNLEKLSAGALLYRLDHAAEVPDLPTLAELGYVPTALAAGDYSLGPDLVASSRACGSAGALATLGERPVTTVTAAEAQAYGQYRDAYSRFWRQFFDPIAIRLDESGPKEMELNVFILPLIDNTIYNSLREGLVHGPQARPLRVPRLEPAPVALFSANLDETAWTNVTRGAREFSTQLGLDPALFDRLGPSVHLAIMDADPVVNLGSGDLLGAFGGDLTRGPRQEMLLFPVLGSLLTRPCQLIVELREPERVREMLGRATTRRLTDARRRSELRADLVQIAGRDAWVCTLDLFNVAKLRLGVQVREGYLVLSNVPWSQLDQVAAPQGELLAGAGLTLNPGAGKAQLAGLFTAACEQQRQVAYAGTSYLYPLLADGRTTLDTALARHRALFGFVPLHPQPGTWQWADGGLLSSRFGNPAHQVQPVYQPGDRDFGLFRDLSQLTLSMQFEDDGLRTKCRWTLP